MNTPVLIHADCKNALRNLIDDGIRVHSIVTDPPYGLVSIRKRFGKVGSAPARTEGNDGSFARLSGGFMGKAWDATGIEHDVEFWKLCLEVLLPGGYLLAFSSPRTGHRMACAIEDAGFVMHPFIGWAYGSGFPKGKAVDKALVKAGKPDEASRWSGWAYGGQVRKPALEPIYVAQKPFAEKNGALNILKHGAGAVNIDGCRAGEEELSYRTTTYRDAQTGEFSGQGKTNYTSGQKTVAGRYPANLIHDGSPEVVTQFPSNRDGSAARFFECYRPLCYRCGDLGWVTGGDPISGSWREACPVCVGRSAASHPFNEQNIFYHPKATKADRAGSKHPTVKPIGLLQALVRHVTPPGGTVLDPLAGTGTTGEAAMREGFHSILIEKEDEYADVIRRRFGLMKDAA